MDALLIIVNKENAVYETFLCKDSAQQESIFTQECQAYGVEPSEADFDNGYIELECGTTLCITSASTHHSYNT
jgi:hypothetical protein